MKNPGLNEESSGGGEGDQIFITSALTKNIKA